MMKAATPAKIGGGGFHADIGVPETRNRRWGAGSLEPRKGRERGSAVGPALPAGGVGPRGPRRLGVGSCGSL